MIPESAFTLARNGYEARRDLLLEKRGKALPAWNDLTQPERDKLAVAVMASANAIA